MNTSDFLKVFLNDFKKLRLRAKIAVILIGSFVWIITSAISYPEAAYARIQNQVNWLRAATSADGVLPLNKSTRNKLVELRRSIETGLVTEIDSRLSEPVEKEQALADVVYNSWTLSELAIAVPYEANKHADAFLQRIESWRHNSGNGWAEFPGDPTIKIPIIAWCISAKIQVFAKLDERNLTFLLSQQTNDGWWGEYAGTKDPENAATYATAVALIAISNVVAAESVTTDQRPHLINAMRKASDWLRVKRTGPFWMDYPNRNGTVRPGLTGIVLHALHIANHAMGDGASSELRDFDRDFIANLRAEHVPPEFSEVAGLNVFHNNIDHVRVYLYPSLILGVVSAYPSGHFKQQAEVISWLDSIVDDLLKVRGIVANYPWVAAEYLISIDYLLSKSG